MPADILQMLIHLGILVVTTQLGPYRSLLDSYIKVDGVGVDAASDYSYENDMSYADDKDSAVDSEDETYQDVEPNVSEPLNRYTVIKTPNHSSLAASLWLIGYLSTLGIEMETCSQTTS